MLRDSDIQRMVKGASIWKFEGETRDKKDASCDFKGKKRAVEKLTLKWGVKLHVRISQHLTVVSCALLHG